MEIPAKRYQSVLICFLLVLLGLTIFAHRAREATRDNGLNPFSRAVVRPATTSALPATTAKNAEPESTGKAAPEPLQSGGTFNVSPSIVAGGGGGGPSEGSGNAI